LTFAVEHHQLARVVGDDVELVRDHDHREVKRAY
jgi:hypothetical protein